jgi:hypothetical protein
MDQKQTLELWARCEGARLETKAAGKSDDDAHAAATAVWNAWAQPLLDQRKAMEAAGTWKAEIDCRGSLEGGNPETTAWLERARAVFSTEKCKHAFETHVSCSGWVFPGTARFDGATFAGTAWFERATFTGDSRFALAKFKGYGTFENAHFIRAASFQAVQGETGFSLAGARFSEVPDFIQANFFQAPRLDNVVVAPKFSQAYPHKAADDSTQLQLWCLWLHSWWSYPWRWIAGCQRRLEKGDRDIPARYRALKRLAIQGHDHEREQVFHAGDITSSRFTTDWPLPYIRRPGWWQIAHEGPVARDDKGKVTKTETKPWRVWADWALRRLWLPAGLAVGPFTADGLSGFFRFWFGLAYGLISNFGRSVLRPLLAWVMLLLVSAGIYLSANPDVQEVAVGKASVVLPYTFDDWWLATFTATERAMKEGQACVRDSVTIKGLPEPVRAMTDARTEALFLALGAGLVLGDIGAPDASVRTYGCLYGLTPTEANKRAVVPYPSYVAGWIVGQKLASAILLFLFGLAVRNMLKMK